MAYEARVIADSISPHGDRLTTIVATYPRFVHAEVMSHRAFSRNTASSRAIPVEKIIDRTLEDPVIPIYWGANRQGMQAAKEIDEDERSSAINLWLEGRNFAILIAAALNGMSSIKDDTLRRQLKELADSGNFNIDGLSLSRSSVHKQITNRLLEPFLNHTALISATEWDNFLALRTDTPAQPEIRRAAEAIREAYEASEPVEVEDREYHLPFIGEEEQGLPLEDIIKISVGRCARISYLTHDGKRDPQKDISLANGLLRDGHMSPFEHVATPFGEVEYSGREQVRDFIRQTGMLEPAMSQLIDSTYFLGNLRGWRQSRKEIPNESDYSKVAK